MLLAAALPQAWGSGGWSNNLLSRGGRSKGWRHTCGFFARGVTGLSVTTAAALSVQQPLAIVCLGSQLRRMRRGVDRF